MSRSTQPSRDSRHPVTTRPSDLDNGKVATFLDVKSGELLTGKVLELGSDYALIRQIDTKSGLTLLTGRKPMTNSKFVVKEVHHEMY